MKWKCKECGAIFEGDEKICPNGCDGKVVPVRENDKRKWYYIVGGIILIILILLLSRCGGDTTTVNVVSSPNDDGIEAEVNLEGKKVSTNGKCNYKIYITREGVMQDKAVQKPRTKKFLSDPGNYEVHVKWVNTHKKAPKLVWNGKRKIYVEDNESKRLPRILDVVAEKKDCKTQTCQMTIKTDEAQLAKQYTEYAVDGSAYQQTPTFTVSAGHHVFHARNINTKKVVDADANVVVRIQTISDGEIEDLLRRIAQKDSKAKQEFINKVQGGSRTQTVPVTGLKNVSNSIGLMNDARTTGAKYKIRAHRNECGFDCIEVLDRSF